MSNIRRLPTRLARLPVAVIVSEDDLKQLMTLAAVAYTQDGMSVEDYVAANAAMWIRNEPLWTILHAWAREADEA